MSSKPTENLREGILDVARRLFISEGMERVTMRRIATELGCSATALYRHFRDKEELINQICHHDFQELQADFLAALQGGDALTRLRALCAAYLRFAQRQPHHYRLLFMTPMSNDQAQSLKANHSDIHGDPSKDGYALLAATIASAQEECQLRRDPDAHLLAQVLWAGLHGIVALELDKRNDPWLPWRDFDQRSALMLDTLLAGFSSSPKTPAAPKTPKTPRSR